MLIREKYLSEIKDFYGIWDGSFFQIIKKDFSHFKNKKRDKTILKILSLKIYKKISNS